MEKDRREVDKVLKTAREIRLANRRLSLELQAHFERNPVLEEGVEEEEEDQNPTKSAEESAEEEVFSERFKDAATRKKPNKKSRITKRKAEEELEEERPAKIANMEAKLDAILQCMSTKQDIATIQTRINEVEEGVADRFKAVETTQEQILRRVDVLEEEKAKAEQMAAAAAAAASAAMAAIRRFT